jgi:hypothetical protein
VALLGAVVFLFSDFIFSDQMLFGTDTIKSGIFFREFLVDHVWQTGCVPGWNPYILCGLPYVDAFHGDIFYPLTLFKYFGPLLRNIGFVYVVHIYLAGFFMFLAARGLGLGNIAAAISATAYAFSPYAVSFVAAGNDGKLFVTALFPLALVLLHRGFDRRPLLNFTLLGLVIGIMILTPHPQMSYYSLLCLSLYGLYRAVGLQRIKRSWMVAVRPLGLFVCAVTLGLLISAIQMYPSFSYTMKHSPRAGQGPGYDFAASWSLHEEELISFAVPEFAGVDSRADSQLYYWGRNGWKDNSESLGIVPVFLALLGLIAYRRKGAVFWAILSVVVMLYALGATTPVFYYLYRLVPLFDKLRAASMSAFVPVFGVSLLAGMCVQSVIESRAFPKGISRYWFITALVAVPLGLAICGLLFHKAGEETLRLYAALIYPELLTATGIWAKKIVKVVEYSPFIARGFLDAAIFAAIAGSIVVGFLRTRISKWWLLLLVFLIASASIRFDQRFISLVDPDEVYGETSLVTYLKTKPDYDRVVQYPHQGGQGFNLFVRTGTYTPLGNHGNEPYWYMDLLLFGGLRTNYFSPQFVNLSSVGYIITHESVNLAPDTLGPIPLDTVGMFDDYILLRNHNCLPRAFLTTRFEVIPDRKEIYAKTLDRQTVCPQVVYLEELPDLENGLDEDTSATAGIKFYGPDSIVVEVDCTSDQLLVLTDTYYPSWKALVDGTESRIYRAYGAFRAVAVPAGSRQVVFVFDSQEGRIGVWLSSFGMVLCLSGLFWSWYRQRRTQS